MLNLVLVILCILKQTNGYWDIGTTTSPPLRTDVYHRLSFFRWQETQPDSYENWPWFGSWDWFDIHRRRQLCVVAGISIDMLPLSTAAILNRRILLTSYNYLDPYIERPRDLRAWVLGRKGLYYTPYRYRIWRFWRVFPKSNNEEHMHGPHGEHQPRHDVSVIITWDQMYIYESYPSSYQYAYRIGLIRPWEMIMEYIIFAGSGYEYFTHIYENYKIFYANLNRSLIVDCSKYLPKWWGKFICFKNVRGFPGIQNGGPLIAKYGLAGVACFEIRYNEDKIFVFTDLRYYVYQIENYADIWPGIYYEYAYPQWYVKLSSFWFISWASNYNDPQIQQNYVARDLYPLGK